MDRSFRLIRAGKAGERGLSARDQVSAILPIFKSTSKREIQVAASLVEHGHRAADTGDYDEAERCFYGLFAIHPELMSVWVDYALCRYANGFEDRILQACMDNEPARMDEILGIHPASSRALMWKGMMLDGRGMQGEALASYKKAQKINRDSLYLLWDIVRIEGQINRNFSRALEIIDTLLTVTPDDLFTLQTRANYLCSQRKYDEAIAAFDRALEIDPNNTVLLTDQGTVFELLGRYSSALECFESAISIAPDNFVALTNMGVVLQATGNYTGAAMCYDKALRIAPDYSNAYYNKARLMAIVGKTRRSIRLLAQAVRLNPNCIERANSAPEFLPLRTNAKFRAIIRQPAG